MEIIGRHLLPDFWQQFPETEKPLRGALALIAAAAWRGDEEVRRQFGSAVRSEGEGGLAIIDPDGRFKLSLRISFTHQIVHIISLQEAQHG